MNSIKNRNTQAQVRNSLLRDFKKNYMLLFMLLPGIIILILFAYKPMLGVLVAFKDYKFKLGIINSPWVGLKNFTKMFQSDDFARVLKNTIVISVLKLICGFPAPIILALLLNEVRNKAFKRVVQTFTYLPHFFSWVVLGGILKILFSTTGPINSMLQTMGMNEPITFLTNNQSFLWLIIWTAVWQSVGWNAILYLAALSNVDESLYEAAQMDGAGKWKQVWHITLPSIMGTIATVLIMNLSGVLDAGFDQIYNMYNPMVYEVADILDTYSIRLLQDGRYEIGTALGLFKSIIGLILVFGANFIIKKVSDDEYGII